jgi:hypothetical protein
MSVGEALLALLVVVMIPAQGAREHIEDQRTPMIRKEQLRND